ncbi:hypothetical protein HZS_6326 [Henneguya salminicola]|nr:hypothetical protein HZS_6326 [Henneguya salminicola]
MINGNKATNLEIDLNDTSSNTSFEDNAIVVNGTPKNKVKQRRQEGPNKSDKKVDSWKYYRKCIKECGINLNYKKFLESCQNENQIKKKLRAYLTEIGIEGRVSLLACKKLRKKLDLQKEFSELNTDLIIDDKTFGRTTRSKKINSTSKLSS